MMLKGIANGVPKDITRIPMKGKQLYDSAHSTAYSAVLDANNMWVNTSTAKSIKIRVEPSTQYTLSIDSPNNSIFRICESDNADITPQSASSAVELTRIVRGTTIKQYTFTTSDYAQCIIFQGSSSSYEQWNSTLMLNIGSTALPYEPYGMQQGWEVRDQNGNLIWGANKTLTGTDSISFKGYGLPLISLSMLGNGQQTGTPTPDNPVMPEFVGVRTGNLFDKNAPYSQGSTTNSFTISGLDPNKYYTCSTNFERISGVYTASVYFNGGSSSSNGVWRDTPRTFKPNSSGEIVVGVRYKGSDGAPAIYNDLIAGNVWVMVNEGSTALPYEPYGWAEYITCGGQTTPVYLGEVPTVRRVRKLVLEGTEDITLQSVNQYGVANFVIPSTNRDKTTRLVLCTHYVQQDTSIDRTNNAGIYNGSSIFIRDTLRTTVNDFKAWLASEYAAGTPVTVWYVLAEPTTGIVNEPLSKIGTYADTLTVTDQDVTITPAVGNDTITVDTALPPSKLTVVGHIRERST